MKGTKLLLVVAVMALMSAALLMTNSGFKLIARRKSPEESSLIIAAESELYARWTTTPGPYGANLKGKMFTLSSAGQGVRFYSPNTESYSNNSVPTTRPPTTRPPTTRSRTNKPTIPHPPTTRPPTTPFPTTKHPTTRHRYWTTTPPFGGVSVCLRYLAARQSNTITLFTLSPTTNPLRLSINSMGTYLLPLTYPYPMFMTPSIPLWRNIDPEIWTRICLTVDNSRNVVQLFSGSNMSIRKILHDRYVWSHEPVIEIPGFDGQVTDIQVWDYPLRYKEVFNYMSNGVYASYRGSVLTWSYISYSLRGNALLEDVYEKQKSQPISSQGRGRGRRPKGEKKTKLVFRDGERRERNKAWFE